MQFFSTLKAARTGPVQWYTCRTEGVGAQSIIEDAKRFLEKGTTGGSAGHYFLGLKILNMLVAEMNQPIPGRTLTTHRKTSVAFRDNGNTSRFLHLPSWLSNALETVSSPYCFVRWFLVCKADMI